MAQFMDMKLERGDTRDALLEKKLRAEMSFQQVSEQYHIVWLNCRDKSKNALTALEGFKSQNLDEKISHPPAAGVSSNTAAYLDWLYASLKRLAPKFEKLLQDLSKATGIEIKQAPLKSKKRVYEKAYFDYQGDQSRLVDICRGSAVADDLEGVVRATLWILNQCQILRFKNRFCDARRDIMARGGYRDILINFELAGFVFELQIHLRPLYVMKEEAHKVLDLARAIIEPTLFKLALLDSQQSHAQLMQKIKDLELQVSSLTIEAAVNAHQGGSKSTARASTNQKELEEWKQKCAQLTADMKRKDIENQELNIQISKLAGIVQPKATQSQENNYDGKSIIFGSSGWVPPGSWWLDPDIKALLRPKSILSGAELTPTDYASWARKIKLQPNDGILYVFPAGKMVYDHVLTQLKFVQVDYCRNILLSQIYSICSGDGKIFLTLRDGKQIESYFGSMASNGSTAPDIAGFFLALLRFAVPPLE